MLKTPEVAGPAPAPSCVGVIEVVLVNGRIMRVAEDIAPGALARLAGALDR
jgi:transposase